MHVFIIIRCDITFYGYYFPIEFNIGYVWNQWASDSIRSHKINALLKDLNKEEMAGDIEAVNIGGLICDLEQKQREFEEINQERVEKKAQTTAKILSIYVTPIRRKIFQILTLLDMLEELDPELYITFVAETNALIDDYVARIRKRETLSEKVSEPQPEVAGS